MADGGTPGGGGGGAVPIVLDLDGDGADLIGARQSKARFDFDGDARKDRIGWIDEGDAFLALDRNRNGKIDDFSELSFVNEFNGAGTDLAGLLGLDEDRDGFLTSADRVFSELLVCKDLNGDGNSQKNELTSLADEGIVSLSLEMFDRSRHDPSGGNQVLGWSVVERADGSVIKAFDVALETITRGSVVSHSEAEALHSSADFIL